MSRALVPDIKQFKFGSNRPFVLPEDQPSPDDWFVYTAWHIWRVLEAHGRDLEEGRHNITVAPIFAKFEAR